MISRYNRFIVEFKESECFLQRVVMGDAMNERGRSSQKVCRLRDTLFAAVAEGVSVDRDIFNLNKILSRLSVIHRDECWGVCFVF